MKKWESKESKILSQARTTITIGDNVLLSFDSHSFRIKYDKNDAIFIILIGTLRAHSFQKQLITQYSRKKLLGKGLFDNDNLYLIPSLMYEWRKIIQNIRNCYLKVNFAYFTFLFLIFVYITLVCHYTLAIVIHMSSIFSVFSTFNALHD